MRVIALPSVYDRPARATGRRWPVLALLIAGMAAPLIAAVFARSQMFVLIGISGAWGILVGFYGFARSSAPLLQGEIGERAALRALAALSDDYTAIASVRIPGYERIGDLDIVLLGPHGIAVIEVKNFRRPIMVDGDNWVALGHNGASPIRSVSRQLRDQIRALKKYLSSHQIDTATHGFIALRSGSTVRIESAPPFPLVPYDMLAERIAELPAARRPLSDVIERKLCSTSTKT